MILILYKIIYLYCRKPHHLHSSCNKLCCILTSCVFLGKNFYLFGKKIRRSTAGHSCVLHFLTFSTRRGSTFSNTKKRGLDFLTSTGGRKHSEAGIHWECYRLKLLFTGGGRRLKLELGSFAKSGRGRIKPGSFFIYIWENNLHTPIWEWLRDNLV